MSNGSTITDNYMIQTNPKNSALSYYNHGSQASIKKVPNMQKRNSQFIKLDMGNNLLKLTTKKSASSIRQQSTLQSIIEHPGEDKNIDLPEEVPKSKLYCQDYLIFYSDYINKHIYYNFLDLFEMIFYRLFKNYRYPLLIMIYSSKC